LLIRKTELKKGCKKGDVKKKQRDITDEDRGERKKKNESKTNGRFS
jgi:hypothetical protein